MHLCVHNSCALLLVRDLAQTRSFRTRMRWFRIRAYDFFPFASIFRHKNCAYLYAFRMSFRIDTKVNVPAPLGAL